MVTPLPVPTSDDVIKPVTVVTADAHGLVRAGLRAVLETGRRVEVTGEAASMAELAASTRYRRPSAVVMDLHLPGADGSELSRLAVPVLLVGDDHDPAQVFAMLRAGARGFAPKSSTSDELVGAVSAVAAGNASLPPEMVGQLLEWFSRQSTPPAGWEAVGRLTERERDVFRLIAEGRSNAEIAEALVVQPSTVKSHVSHLLRKLGVSDRAHAVAVAYRSGLLHYGPGPVDVVRRRPAPHPAAGPGAPGGAPSNHGVGTLRRERLYRPIRRGGDLPDRRMAESRSTASPAGRTDPAAKYTTAV